MRTKPCINVSVMLCSYTSTLFSLNDEWMNSTGLLTSDHIFKCTGSEDQLSDCKHTSKYFPQGSYAGVICTTEAKGELIL